MKKLILALCIYSLLHTSNSQENPVGPIGAFLRTNLVGHPVLHKEQEWIFEPDVASRRRKQFIELHGDKAERLIERLGLGIDGLADERLIKQRQRDEGHLGGLNFYLH